MTVEVTQGPAGLRHQLLRLQSTDDVVAVRHAIRDLCTALGFSLVDQTKMVTAASELARNAIVHGGGGEAEIEVLEADQRRGIRATFTDSGPGIADAGLALRDGFSTSRGLGLGLGGARRLVNEFHLESGAGAGTRVVITRWK